jgi:hypothetical protein
VDLAHAQVIVPQSPGAQPDGNARGSVDSFVPVPGRLYGTDIIGGPPARARL